MDKLEIIDRATDIIFLTLMLLQNVTNKSQDEILDSIKAEGAKTDNLLMKLR